MASRTKIVRQHGAIISTLDRSRYGENAAVLNKIAGKPTILLSAGVFHIPALKRSHHAAARFSGFENSWGVNSIVRVAKNLTETS
ncbi:MAG: hypothetical protein II754_00715 [Lachnospiraceae bacterium]|nr:hypothetical protein [Lachnospiraceae bacterium]